MTEPIANTEATTPVCTGIEDQEDQGSGHMLQILKPNKPERVSVIDSSAGVCFLCT